MGHVVPEGLVILLADQEKVVSFSWYLAAGIEVCYELSF